MLGGWRLLIQGKLIYRECLGGERRSGDCRLAGLHHATSSDKNEVRHPHICCEHLEEHRFDILCSQPVSCSGSGSIKVDRIMVLTIVYCI